MVCGGGQQRHAAIGRLRLAVLRAGNQSGKPTSIEMCAGAGGQAIGLDEAGFDHLALVELDHFACETLRHNTSWNVVEDDITSERVRKLASTEWKGVDLLAGGVPCPPFSIAGKKLGELDERDLFPAMLRLAQLSEPKAIMIENVRGLLDPKFDEYRDRIDAQLKTLGYQPMGWKLLNAKDYGVPQLRPRVVMVALKRRYASRFEWPAPTGDPPVTVGEALLKEMASRGWPGAEEWCSLAGDVAPTLVGGSKKHGGPDLGPTRARQAWARLGVNAKTIAEEPPGPEHVGPPRLTVQMAALVQGFPPGWKIMGRKTQAYRQVGNAFPPPVAKAVGEAIKSAIAEEAGLQETA